MATATAITDSFILPLTLAIYPYGSYLHLLSMIIGCCSHFGPSVPHQGVEVSLHVEVSRRRCMEDPRRCYILRGCSADARLGKIWLSDWDAAHSPWADHFDLIVNCSHKEGRYRRRNVGFWMEMGLNMDVPTLQQAVKKVMRAML